MTLHFFLQKLPLNSHFNFNTANEHICVSKGWMAPVRVALWPILAVGTWGLIVKAPRAVAPFKLRHRAQLVPPTQRLPLTRRAGAAKKGGGAKKTPLEWDEKPVSYSSITVGVPKELFPGEKRVAQTPITVAALVKQGFTVMVEQGAGGAATFTDEAYRDAGAQISENNTVWSADIILKIHPPTGVDQRPSLLRAFHDDRIACNWMH
jgi:hypothetical protein